MLRTSRSVGFLITLLCAPVILYVLTASVMGVDEWPEDPPALESGDINGDWKIDLTDAVDLLGYLFLGTPAPAPVYCDTTTPSGDANGDGRVDLSDAVYLLEHHFRGGPPPAPLCDDRVSEIGKIVQQILEEPTEVRHDIRLALAATVRFRTPEQARDAGFVRRSETACVNGIGFPWIDEEAYGSSVEPSRPAICYYAPDENGELRIVALEWVMLVEAVPAPPVLFGQPMNGPLGPVPELQIPQVYYRQMHLYQHNPDGLFTALSPRTTGVCGCGDLFCP